VNLDFQLYFDDFNLQAQIILTIVLQMFFKKMALQIMLNSRFFFLDGERISVRITLFGLVVENIVRLVIF
jgi:hypothetical protein